MLRVSTALCLCLVASPVSAFSSDLAATVGLHLVAQEVANPIERELSDYLDQDDIAGAKAFVQQLAANGEIDETEQRALEDRIWRTKSERTLEYARKIREAIRASDLETMRDYNARMKRLTAVTPSDAPSTPDEASTAVETSTPVETPTPAETSTPVEASTPAEAETAVVPDEDVKVSDTDGTAPVPDEPGDAADDQESMEAIIADLTRRGEQAIATYNLSVARPGVDSALGMTDQLAALGPEGEEAAKALGQKILTVYEALVERDIGRGRLDKARTFVERMDEVAERAGLPKEEIDDLRSRIDQTTIGSQEHERLLEQAIKLRNRGQLVQPRDDNALASAAKALKLDVDQSAASTVLDDVIFRQRMRADRLAESGRLRDAAHELEMLANALLAADIDKLALVADLRAKMAALYRRADIRDSERARRTANEASVGAETPAPTEGGGDSSGEKSYNPFTFINPF